MLIRKQRAQVARWRTCHRFFGNDRAERRAERRGTSRMLSRASGESVGKALPTAVT